MTLRVIMMLAVGLIVAACEPERGTGFTGIGTQAAVPAYDLDLSGVTPGH